MQSMETLLGHELWESEELVWSGFPLKSDRGWTPFSRKSRTYLVLGLVLTIIALAIEIVIGDLPAGKESFILIPGMVLLIIGSFLFLLEKLFRYVSSSTTYAITTRRIIILQKNLYPRMMMFNIKTIKDVHCSEERDGSGNLFFSGSALDMGFYRNKDTGYLNKQSVFKSIAQVRLVEQRMLSATEQAKDEQAMQIR